MGCALVSDMIEYLGEDSKRIWDKFFPSILELLKNGYSDVVFQLSDLLSK